MNVIYAWSKYSMKIYNSFQNFWKKSMNDTVLIEALRHTTSSLLIYISSFLKSSIPINLNNLFKLKFF